MCAAAGATAQTKSAVPAPAADTVLLSETADGDYIVRRFIVKSRGDADYSIRYQINLATLNAALNGNPQELDGLNAFVDNLVKDTLRQVCAVTITGYSSPDGPLKFNEALAAKRAGDFKAYVDRKYDFSKKYKVTVNSVAEDWETCRALVAQSSMPDRQSVLNVIDGKQSSDQKELALKKMPAAWSYLKKNVLPKLRRVELTIGYGAGNIVEQRTMIPKPKPAPQPQPAQPAEPYVVVDEQVNGIIVEMPDRHEYKKEVREESREVKKEARAAERLAKKEAREAQKIVRQQEKAAKKIAKKEAKAAKKAGRIAAEGMSYALVENGVGALVEVNCETDFCAKSDLFVAFVKDIAKAVLDNDPADVDALMNCKYPGTELTVSETMPEKVMSIGENLQIRRFVRYAENTSVAYVHAGGKIGVLVNLAVEGVDASEIGKNVAMQIAALNPRFWDKSQVTEDVLAEEKKIALALMDSDPKMASKPAQVKEKIVMGKMNKFYEENCLLQQAFVKDGDVSVEQYMNNAAKALGGKVSFNTAVRFEKGEGLEKRNDDFASEVANMVK